VSTRSWVQHGRFFSLFLLPLSAGGLVWALITPYLERCWGLTVTLGILADVLAIAFSFAARDWEQTWPSISQLPSGSRNHTRQSEATTHSGPFSAMPGTCAGEVATGGEAG
jgi:hypothetical protein